MRRLAMVLWIGLVIGLAACSAEPVDLFAQQTEQAVLTITPATPTPENTPTPSDASATPNATPKPCSTAVQSDGLGGLEIILLDAIGNPLDWLPADGRTEALVRIRTQIETFANRPLAVITSGGGRVRGDSLTTGNLGDEPLTFIYTSDVVAGIKRIEAQVALADGCFETYSAEVDVRVEPLIFSGTLLNNNGAPIVRLTLRKIENSEGVIEPMRGTYPIRVLTDARIANLTQVDGSAIPADGMKIDANSGDFVDIRIQRLTEEDTITLSAFVVGRGELEQWRDTLHPIYPNSIVFTQVNGSWSENRPEGNQRYIWYTQGLNNLWCAVLRGSGDYLPPLVTFRATPILELMPGRSIFTLSSQQLAMGEIARTDEARFRGTNFVAHYNVCAGMGFQLGTGGVYQLEVTAGVSDVTAKIPVVIYTTQWRDGDATQQNRWIGFFGSDGQPLPPLQMDRQTAPQIFFIETYNPDVPVLGVAAFWARLSPESRSTNVKPLGEELWLTGNILEYSQDDTAVYRINAPAGLSQAWIFEDGAGRRYTQSAHNAEWTRVYAIVRVAAECTQLASPEVCETGQ